MTLYYRLFGEENSEPLIILHGLFGLSDNWLNIAKNLGKRYRVYVVDNRNHGQSPRSNVWNYDVMAADLKNFLDTHSLKKAHILGHSMGGKIAMRFAEVNPEYIEKLIVVDIAPRFYPPHHHAVLEALDKVDFNIVKSRKDVELIIRSVLHDEATVQFILKNVYWKENGKLDFRFNYAVIRQNIETIGEACFEFGICTLPTLFVRGEHSNYITNNDIEEIYQKFTRVKVKTVLNAGHWVHAENPSGFMDVLTEFLEADN